MPASPASSDSGDAKDCVWACVLSLGALGASLQNRLETNNKESEP